MWINDKERKYITCRLSVWLGNVSNLNSKLSIFRLNEFNDYVHACLNLDMKGYRYSPTMESFLIVNKIVEKLKTMCGIWNES